MADKKKLLIYSRPMIVLYIILFEVALLYWFSPYVHLFLKQYSGTLQAIGGVALLVAPPLLIILLWNEHTIDVHSHILQTLYRSNRNSYVHQTDSLKLDTQKIASLDNSVGKLEERVKLLVEQLNITTPIKDELPSISIEKERNPLQRINDFVAIPKGRVLYGESMDEIIIEHNFEMALFPVLNIQYRRFYDSPDFTTYFTDKDRRGPSQWEDPRFNRAEMPVVEVNWYEASAYCKWLTENKKDGYIYELPSEQQWIYCASGNRKMDYPWGNEFQMDACNSQENFQGGLATIGMFPKNESPFGCLEMSGNIWEWTTTTDSITKMVLKGGSWESSAEHCSNFSRISALPSDKNRTIGFRISRRKISV